jgi:hypothetical protein
VIYNSLKISKEIYTVKNNTFFDKTFFQFAKTHQDIMMR